MKKNTFYYHIRVHKPINHLIASISNGLKINTSCKDIFTVGTALLSKYSAGSGFTCCSLVENIYIVKNKKNMQMYFIIHQQAGAEKYSFLTLIITA